MSSESRKIISTPGAAMTSYRGIKRQVLHEAVDHVRGMADITYETTAPLRPDGYDDPDSTTGENWRRACNEIADWILTRSKEEDHD